MVTGHYGPFPPDFIRGCLGFRLTACRILSEIAIISTMMAPSGIYA